MEKNFKNLFGLIKEKSVPAIDSISEQTRDAQPKAYIPKFMYKPPFGYPRFVDIPNIRRLAASPYVDMCITAIIDEACAVPWDIVIKEGKEDSENAQKHVDHVKAFYDNPNTNKESFEEIRRKYLRDILEIDSGVLNKLFNMKEEMVEMVARDGAIFTKNPDVYGMMTEREDLIPDVNIATSKSELSNMAHAAANPKELGFATAGWITSADVREKAAYFQYGWIAGARPVPFGKKEIIWFERNPRTDAIYGRSPVQVLAETIQTLIYAVESNLEYFSDNQIPRGIIGLENANTEEVKAFKEQWKENQRVKDSAGNWKKQFHKIPIVNKTPVFTRLELTNQELELIEQQKWWAKLVWACYSEDTEILTDDGFKLFKDLKDEKVARVNPKNLEIDFVKPIDKQEYDFDGELINYKTKSCDLLVTPEHKMLMCNDKDFYEGNIKWEEKQAKDFERGIIPQAGHFVGKKIDELNFESKCKQISKDFDTQKFNISGDNFVKFMGIWLSDGWIESANNRIVLCASDVYPENKEFIEKLLKDMDVDYKVKISESNAVIQGKEVNINGEMNYYRFSNKAFHDYLIQFGKAKEKYIPKIILNTDKNQIELFLDAFMFGDGSKGHKGKNDRYGSMSKSLMNGLQEMLIKNGKSATLFQNSFNDCWELTVRKTKSEKIENKYYSRIIKENVLKEKYKGKVYDVTVPEHHFLIVRRNGRVSISGNCFGVTGTELGFTEDAKGMANQIVQSNVFRKRTLNPILRMEEYKHNKEIVSEFEYDDVEFKFLMFDVDEEQKKANLYQTQLAAGFKSINEIRVEEGMEEVEWGDKQSPEEIHQQEMDKLSQQSDLFETSGKEEADIKKKTKKDKKILTGEKKAVQDNPLILREFETPGEERLEESIIYVLNDEEKKIKELIGKEMGEKKIIGIKSVDGIAKRIKELLSFSGLKAISDAVIKYTFLKGWDYSEKQVDKNLMVNNGAIEFIQDYTFNNIKGMTDDIMDKLRQELQRGIINGEGITKLKARVSKVFNVGKNRAEMIARTEITRSENQGRLLAMKESGLDMKKKWSTHEDDRTSPICKRLDGQVVGINENFKDPGSDWEGQAPPSHVNCRSAITFELEE